MRRLASVFVVSSRRTDRSDAPSSTSQDDASPHRLPRKKSRVFSSLSRKHLSSTDPTSLPPLIATDLANSSSSSSSGSTTLRTPDDDGLPCRPSKKSSWKSWLGGKDATLSDRPEERHTPCQSPRDILHLPNPTSTETDRASLHSDDPYGPPDDVLITSYSPEQMAIARANARTMILNSLVTQPSSAPLFQSPEAISFPRSCHNHRRLRCRETLESELHKKSLLARLDRLSPSAESSIVSLASKSIPPKPQPHWKFQDDVFPSADSVTFHSRGLENWVARPCFEDRLQLWIRSETDEIVRIRVSGSHLGVAALEFSESLELLAGTLLENDEDVGVDITFDPASEFTLPPLVLNLDPPAAQMKEPESEPPTPPSNVSQKDFPAKLSPSQQAGAVSLALSNTLSPAQQAKGPTSSGSATNDFVPKRGVRFADDDGKDDQIPLGHVLRIRKNKEQKAQFLREERERRARAARFCVENRQPTTPQQDAQVSRVVVPRRPPPRPLISLHEPLKSQKPVMVSQVVGEEERLRREVEKIEMEKLKRSRELARKQGEERERAYVEELQATRARREAVRAGRPLLESASLSPRTADRSRSGSRDSTHASLRGPNISHKHTPELVFTPVSPHGGSPSSSVPATPGSQYSHSRPPSLYSAHTASSEDVRARDGRLVSRRMSVLSDTTKGIPLHPPYDPRASFNPYVWTNIPPVPPMPALPMVNGMPFYGMDMPLLPPTPPFMINEFGVRSRSYTGSPGQSPLQSWTSLPRNYSSERVSSSSRNSSPHSFGSHQRRSSDDAPCVMKSPGSSRPGSYTDVRGSKASVSIRGTPSQSPQRSSFVSSEQKRSSSLRPVSGAYISVPPAHTRRRTAAS